MSTTDSEFSGRTVAIVGGSNGVGPAVVRAFLERDVPEDDPELE